VLLVLWAIALAFVAALPLAFPEWQSASFFSASLVAEREAFDFLGLYIPRNPLFSMAHDVVPAVVVFSMAMGVALIGVERKDGLLGGLDALGDALTRVTGFVARLAPIGVFALTASAAGTMGLEEVKRLQVYLVTYAAAAMLLAFWILPGLVAALTPLRWGEVVRPTRDATVTAFATGNLLVVLPFLTEAAKEIAAAGLPPLRRLVRRLLDPGRRLPGLPGDGPVQLLRADGDGGPVPARLPQAPRRPLPRLRDGRRDRQPLRGGAGGHEHGLPGAARRVCDRR
jgi:hypothetical protein